MAQKIEAVLLDVYDTSLILRTPALVRPYERMLTSLGCVDPMAQLLQDRDLLIEDMTSFEQYLRHYQSQNPELAKMPERRVQEILQEAEDNLVYHLGCYDVRPQFYAFYQQAVGYNLKVGQVSNLSEPYTHAVIETFPLKYQFFSCELKSSKPSAKLFHLCCEEMGVKPEATIMIGNSIKSDIVGANDAGLAMSFWMPEPGKKYTQEDFQKYNGIKNLNEIFPRLKKAGFKFAA